VESTLYGHIGHTFDTNSGHWRPGLYLQRSSIEWEAQDRHSVEVVEPRLHWGAESSPVDGELGFAHSNYEEEYTVKQWSPTVGVNGGPLRLQLRGYFIDSDAPSPVAGGSSQALETTLSLRLGKSRSGSLYAQYLAGERVNPVDRDLYYLIPMANRQHDSWRAGVALDLSERWQWGVMTGRQRFTIDQFDYEMDFVGTSLAGQF
jgi:hypothetical protein